MLEEIQEILSDRKKAAVFKIQALKSMITISALEKESIEELKQIYTTLQFYFKVTLPYFCFDQKVIKESEQFFLSIFCNKTVIAKLFSKKEPIEKIDDEFLSRLGMKFPKSRNENQIVFESDLYFAFLNYGLEHLEQELPNILLLLTYLTDEEEREWIQSHTNTFTKKITSPERKFIANIFKALAPHVLEQCYVDAWKCAFLNISPIDFFKLLDCNENLMKNESIRELVFYHKKRLSKIEQIEHFSYYYFEQPIESLYYIYQILMQTTYLPLLSNQEQQLASIVIKLFQSPETRKESLFKLHHIPDYLTLLYELCYHLREMASKSLTSHVFTISPHLKQKTVVIDESENYSFFIRTNDRTDPFLSKGQPVQSASFSIIHTHNLSTYLGHERTIFGYSHIDPTSILHIYPQDSLSNDIAKPPYIPSKFPPYYVDHDTLLEMSKSTYNEIVVAKNMHTEKQLQPDYILGIGAFSAMDEAFARELHIPKVKILVKNRSHIETKDFYTM